MNRQLLSQKEYDEIAASGSFDRAIEVLSRYVKKKVGPIPTGRAMTSTERTHKRRARLRRERGQ